MTLIDRIRAIEKQLGEIWKELTPFRGTGGGGGVPGHHLTHEPGGADAITVLPDHHTEHESGGGDIIKLDDLGAPDDNTDLNASATKHGLCPKGGADLTKFLRHDLTFQPVTSGGANILKLWTPDAFPTGYSPADSDHFDDGSIGAMWTAFQPAASFSAAESGSHLKLANSGDGAFKIRGYYRHLPDPSANWTIYFKINHIRFAVNYFDILLSLYEDATGNPNTSNILSFGIENTTNSWNVYVVNAADYQTWTSNLLQIAAASFAPTCYFRIRKNGTNLYFEGGGPSGNSWALGGTWSTGTYFTPHEYGPTLMNQSGSACWGWFDFICLQTSDDPYPQGNTAEFWVT